MYYSEQQSGQRRKEGGREGVLLPSLCQRRKELYIKKGGRERGRRRKEGRRRHKERSGKLGRRKDSEGVREGGW